MHQPKLNQNERILDAEGLCKSFGSNRVVNNVDIEITSGKIVGLLGPNGAGKTTCFYMIVGLLRPDSGKVSLNELDITQNSIDQRARKGIAYLPQEASVFQKLTVTQNIQSVLELRFSKGSSIRTRCDQLLDEFKLSHVRNNKGYMLSGGERRRVEIARTLALDPEFILLDEPFAGIDPIAVQDIQEIIRELKSKNIGILITDHNVRETLGICDYAYIITQGEILMHGGPKEVAESPVVRSTYLGENFKF